MYRRLFAAFAIGMSVLLGIAGRTSAQHDTAEDEPTDNHRRLSPQYPADRNCSPLTSLFSSWDDVDGSKRAEPHTGLDGGRLGEPILAPASGTVIAVWRANWGWGAEGALMIRHERADLGLSDGPTIYYSEFDHLSYDEISPLAIGTRVSRGQQLATVFRPGGSTEYEPEVHWEVWTIDDETATQWKTNKFGGRYWFNKTGHLRDPLYMLSLNAPPRDDNGVDIPIFEPGRTYRGFTYFLPCVRKMTRQ